MKTSKDVPCPPAELAEALRGDDTAAAFFQGLADGYRRRYCDWVAAAKDPATRTSRARHAVSMLRDGQKSLKVGSFMGDVGIIKRIDDDPALRDELFSLCAGKSHRDVSRYGLLLAEHVLSLTGVPPDDAIRKCFDINRKWQEGAAHFQEARDVAGELFQLARREKDPVRRKVLRILGQVAATPHVKRHALIASEYAVTLVNLLHPGNLDEVKKERACQIALMNRI